jgi:hypothetical protein
VPRLDVADAAVVDEPPERAPVIAPAGALDSHADDQWSVDALLSLAGPARQRQLWAFAPSI